MEKDTKWIKISVTTPIYDGLKQVAEINHRSVKGQVEFMIEQAFRPANPQPKQTEEPESVG